MSTGVKLTVISSLELAAMVASVKSSLNESLITFLTLAETFGSLGLTTN